MRCTTYCTSDSYDLTLLLQESQKLGEAQHLRDCVHLCLSYGNGLKGDVFYFSYGALVLWNFPAKEEAKILERLKPFEKGSLLKPELDEFTFTYGEAMKIEEDEIVLNSKNTLTKLAVSYGLAQSVKLTTFEEAIKQTIHKTKHLPEDLAHKGKIFLSRKEISQKMGALFIERNFINLNSEVLDTPEFFWNYPELEPFYRRTAHYLDIMKRIETLNKRLNVVHELFEILSNELNHQHSSRLEWTIIILIVIEVIIALMRDLLHLI